jgi:hypothetical protein
VISSIGGILIAATAAASCPESDRGTLQEWMCFGEVTFTARIEGRPEFDARFVLFDGRERLYEKRGTEGVKSMLRVEGYELYRGLGAEDSTVIGNFNPFLFFEFALVVPHIALAASEGAPAMLPAGATPVRYAGAGRATTLMQEMGIRSVEGAIERSGADYAFHAEILTTAVLDAHTSVRGRWSNARVAPYPDSMPLAGWQYGCPRPGGVDVRGNHRPVPPGVTLGDVRRGWRGPCD